MVLEATKCSASSPDKENFATRIARNIQFFAVVVESEADRTETAYSERVYEQTTK